MIVLRTLHCAGIGASLAAEEVTAFDDAHAALLDEIAPPEFDLGWFLY